jgi:hypothetical protein
VAGQGNTERRSTVNYHTTDDEAIGTEIDVLGLYQADVAAVAAQTTACDPGSGPVRIDD